MWPLRNDVISYLAIIIYKILCILNSLLTDLRQFSDPDWLREVLLLLVIESLRVFSPCLLYRADPCELLHRIHLFIEVLASEIIEVLECEDRISLFDLLINGHLNYLLFLDNLNLCLEEAASIDDLAVLDHHRFHFWQ